MLARRALLADMGWLDLGIDPGCTPDASRLQARALLTRASSAASELHTSWPPPSHPDGWTPDASELQTCITSAYSTTKLPDDLNAEAVGYILFEHATPAYALLERLFERALARASACASLHIEVLPAFLRPEPRSRAKVRCTKSASLMCKQASRNTQVPTSTVLPFLNLLARDCVRSTCKEGSLEFAKRRVHQQLKPQLMLMA